MSAYDPRLVRNWAPLRAEAVSARSDGRCPNRPHGAARPARRAVRPRVSRAQSGGRSASGLFILFLVLCLFHTRSVADAELLRPDAPELVTQMQLWLRADDLPLRDGARVYRWPDWSGHGRDASPTVDAFDGSGTPPGFVKNSAVNGRPAVRFAKNNGLGTPGDRPMAIQGDAAFTVFVVANLKYQEGASHDVIVGFGEPLNATNTTGNRPGAALLEIDRTPEGRHRLDHAGGFKRDATIGRPGSYASFYDQPQVIALVKRPGSMRDTTSILINGEPIDRVPATGSSAVPDLHHRKDFGVILGHAHPPTGSLDGDIAEVVIYNAALTDAQRRGVERHLLQKYAITADALSEDPGPNLVPAERRKHWAFQAPIRPRVPAPRGDADGGANPIDAFLLERLRAHNLGFSPEAGRAVLFRRLHFDLTGLPPEPGELRDFVASTDPNAYERSVDRLLQSPHFGERWGRHWLDLAGYVDVTGNDQNAEQIILGQSKWRYRDYVIRALNDGKPWDRFLMEQIAGDELTDWRGADRFTREHRDLLIATGYLRTAIDDTHEVDLNKVPFRYQVIHDTVQILGSSLFALTLQCARCHDHKFDPIPARDYYRMMSLLTPALNAYAWLQPKDREIPDVSVKEQADIVRGNGEIDRRIKPLADTLESMRGVATNRLLDRRLAAVSEATRGAIRTALAATAGKPSAAEKALLKDHEPELKISREDVDQILSSDERFKIGALEGQIVELKAQRKKWDDIRAFFESGPPPRDFIFKRGDYSQRGPRIGAGLLSALCSSDSEAMLLETNLAKGESSGRRLQFARWLTKPDGAPAGLHARVWMNRTWQQLVGEGLVATPDSFGINGLPPSHPELLDWLAREFIDSGWSFKPMIKRMVTSAAYRQASRRCDDGVSPGNPAHADPDNTLLWHQRLRRVESECVRDAILAVSGKLDRTLFGPAVPLIHLPDGTAALPPDDKMPTPTSKWRRTIYLMGRRNFHLPILGSFDQPVINTTCSRRMSSAVVLQPLTMLNDPFVVDQATHFAQRVEEMATTPSNRVETAFLLAYGRPPAPDELQSSLNFLREQSGGFRENGRDGPQAEKQALITFCQMLMNASEFLYID